MSLWVAVLLSALLAYLTKLVGYLVPSHHLEHPRVTRVAGTMTVGLLAALLAANAFGSGQGVAVDARLVALLAAGLALALRAPFIVVVLVGAIAAALSRQLGWG